MFNRRHFVLGAAGSLASIKLFLRAAPTDATYQQFHRNLLSKPWLKLYEGLHHADTSIAECTVEGEIPEDLIGSLYRNGPGRFEHKGRRYQHWFDGDGLVQKWSIQPNNTVTHHARLVQTQKYLHDEANDALSRVGFGTSSDDNYFVNSPDSLNVGNISMLAREQELWALWEAGSPWRIDADSLATNGMVQLNDESSGLPFSAHPRVEADGSLWNFGCVSHMGLLVIWHLPPGSWEPKLSIIPKTPMSMPHDFVVTENHLVLPLPPLHYEPESHADTFLASHGWHPDRSLELIVMDKNNPSEHYVVELPAQWVFHYSNAWEDKDGIIRFEGVRQKDARILFDDFKSVMVGESPKSQLPTEMVRYRIDTKKRTVSEEIVDIGFAASEFPSIDQRKTTKKHKFVNMLVASSPESGAGQFNLFDGIARLATETGAIGHFTFPEHQAVEEHIFVPKPEGKDESQGWLVGTSLDYMNEQSYLNIFETNELNPKLIARASLPRLMPIGLHGKFVAAT